MDNGPAHRNKNAAQWQKGEKILLGYFWLFYLHVVSFYELV